MGKIVSDSACHQVAETNAWVVLWYTASFVGSCCLRYPSSSCIAAHGAGVQPAPYLIYQRLTGGACL